MSQPDQLNKFAHWLAAYDRHLSSYRDQPINLLTVGTGSGANLTIWQNYFGESAKISTLAQEASVTNDGIEVIVVDPTVAQSYTAVQEQLGTIDVLVVGTGFGAGVQQLAFEQLYLQLAPKGICICEDLHQQDSSLRSRSKDFVDRLNAWHSRQDDFVVNEFTQTTYSLHYYAGMLVIQRRPMQASNNLEIGKKTVSHGLEKVSSKYWRREVVHILVGKVRKLFGLK